MKQAHSSSSLSTSHPKNRRSRLRSLGLMTLLTLVTVLLTFIMYRLYALTHSQTHREERRLPVVVAAVKRADVPVYLSALGTVTPDETVTVKTQVNGQLLHVFFKEGQFVKAGDVLADIDPRLWQAQLQQYTGQLARDHALLVNAQTDLKRYQILWRQNAISKQTLDTQSSLVKQYEGAIKFDEGLIASTIVNLHYAHITAPISGRIGLMHVNAGNVVQTSDLEGIAVINTMDPISVIFSIPEDALPQVLTPLKMGTRLTTDAYDRKDNTLLASGTLVTVDNQIDPSTGTIKLKADFQNPGLALFPNQFVNIRLLIQTLNQASVVPTSAIQHSAQGTFVYRLNQNNTVSLCPVTIGVSVDHDTVIKNGVMPDQLVVIEGADKLSHGAEVKVSSLHVMRQASL